MARKSHSAAAQRPAAVVLGAKGLSPKDSPTHPQPASTPELVESKGGPEPLSPALEASSKGETIGGGEFAEGSGEGSSVLAAESRTSDAAVPEVDAAVPEVDAAVPEVDAAVPEVDAAVPEVDAAVREGSVLPGGPSKPSAIDAGGTEPSSPEATATEPSATEPAATETSATETSATETSATETSATETSASSPALGEGVQLGSAVSEAAEPGAFPDAAGREELPADPGQRIEDSNHRAEGAAEVALEEDDVVSPVNYDDEGLLEVELDEALYRFDAGKQGTALCLSVRTPGSWRWRFLGELKWDGRDLRSRQLERRLLGNLSRALREFSASAAE